MTSEALVKRESYDETCRNNDLMVADLIAEHRDTLMRKHIHVADKFIDKLRDHVEGPQYDEETPKEQRKILGSVTRTLEILTNIQAKAAKFDHLGKPKEDQGQGRVSLFVNMAPVGYNAKPCIDVTAE